MDNEKIVKNWQAKIISICEDRLKRKLSQNESYFIKSRGGFMALEIIEDTVQSLTLTELDEYLNSEY